METDNLLVRNKNSSYSNGLFEKNNFIIMNIVQDELYYTVIHKIV